MSKLSPDAIRLSQIMRRWRRQFLNDDDKPILHGMGKIRNAIGIRDKNVVRGLLDELIDAGHVKIFNGTNGVFYRSLGPDKITGITSAERIHDNF